MSAIARHSPTLGQTLDEISSPGPVKIPQNGHFDGGWKFTCLFLALGRVLEDTFVPFFPWGAAVAVASGGLTGRGSLERWWRFSLEDLQRSTNIFYKRFYGRTDILRGILFFTDWLDRYSPKASFTWSRLVFRHSFQRRKSHACMCTYL